jgi:hypothetical protein
MVAISFDDITRDRSSSSSSDVHRRFGGRIISVFAFSPSLYKPAITHSTAAARFPPRKKPRLRPGLFFG